MTTTPRRMALLGEVLDAYVTFQGEIEEFEICLKEEGVLARMAATHALCAVDRQARELNRELGLPISPEVFWPFTHTFSAGCSDLPAREAYLRAMAILLVEIEALDDDQVEREKDTVGAFLDECCVQGFGAVVEQASDLYEAYKIWCATRLDPILAPLTALAFGKDLKFRGLEFFKMLDAKYWRGVALVIPWKIRLKKAQAERDGAPA